MTRSLTDVLNDLCVNDPLPFDAQAARKYANQLAELRSRNYTMSTGDAMIAAIARVHGFAVATRDVEPFHKAGIAVLDPWAIS